MTHHGEQPVSLAMLERLSGTGEHRAAIATQAILHLQGKGVPQDLEKGRLLLRLAAFSFDRLSAARLSIYYHNGKYGFPIDQQLSISWRDRVTRRLISDAFLIYDDPRFKEQAESQLRNWKSTCIRVWGEFLRIDPGH